MFNNKKPNKPFSLEDFLEGFAHLILFCGVIFLLFAAAVSIYHPLKTLGWLP